MPAIPLSTVSQGPAAGRIAVEDLRIARTGTSGRVTLGGQHLEADGCVGVPFLFALAAELTQAGIAAERGAGWLFRACDVKTLFLAPVPTDRLLAEAVPLPAPDGMVIWQTTIQTGQGVPLAGIVQTGRISPIVCGTDRPADCDAPAQGDSMTTEADADPSSQRRERIVIAATEIIARKGFGNATIREIAEAAGVHVPTLYQHVSGKDELLELVYSHEMERLAWELDIAGSAEGSASDKMARMIAVAIDVSERRRRQIGILNRELKSLAPDARARTLSQYRKLVQRYETVLVEGIDSGEFHEIDHLLAANFIDMVSDMWALRPFFLKDYDLEEYRRTATDFVLAGLRRADG